MEFETRAGAAGQRKPRSVRSLLLMFSIAFLAGIGATGWGLSRWDGARQWLFGRSPDQEVPAVAPKAVQLPVPVVSTPNVAERLADLEARIARIEFVEHKLRKILGIIVGFNSDTTHGCS